MAAQKRQLSLDTNLVLDLAAGKDFAHEFREIFQGKDYALALPPTAAGELHAIFKYGSSAAERALAQTALSRLLDWSIHPLDLDSTAEVICGEFVRNLFRLRLLPDDEINDGLILAETSFAGIPLLVTSDKHLLNMDEDALLLAFNDADLPPVHRAHPKNLLRALR